MSDSLFAAFDLGLVVAAAFGLGLWQLIAVRRSIRRDREKAQAGRPSAGRSEGA